MKQRLVVGVCVLSLLIGVALRLWASTRGSNWDVERAFYPYAQDLVTSGSMYSLYQPGHVGTNYGPGSHPLLWAALQLARLTGHDTAQGFHFFWAGFLSLADVAIAVTLGVVYGAVPLIIYILSPVVIMITGYHSQIDNLAVLFALWSWLLLRRDQVWPAAVCMALSVATKHSFVMFPMCALFWPGISWYRRMLYAAASGVGVVLLLAPIGPSGWAALRAYHGINWYGNGLIPRLFPAYPDWWQPLFVGGVLVVGALMARRLSHALFVVYPIALLAFAPTMTDQYLTIPMTSMAILWRRTPLSWLYAAVATGTLMASRNNLCSRINCTSLVPWLQVHGFAHQVHLPVETSTLYAQVAAILLLAWFAISSERSRAAGWHGFAVAP